MKNTQTMIVAILGTTVVGTAGFFIGRHADTRLAQRQWAGNTKQAVCSGGMRGHMADEDAGGFRGRMGAIGEITKIDGSTVTVQLPDGSTKEVTVSDETVVDTVTKGTTKDLKVGQTIHITGGGFWNDMQTIIVKP